MQLVKKSLEEQQHKTDDVWNGVTQTTNGTANSYRSVDCREGFRRTENMRWRLRSRTLPRLRRKPSLQQQRKHDNEQNASYAKEHVAKVGAGLQKIYDGILALMDKNLIPSARRITGAEGHQQRTLQRSSSLAKSILNRSQRSDRLEM